MRISDWSSDVCSSDLARHEVRKDAKKLRYASEFFTSLFDRKRERRRHKKFVAALEGVQDKLGALNDLATAPQLLEQLGLADDPDAARLLAGGKRKALLAAAAAAHVDLIDVERLLRCACFADRPVAVRWCGPSGAGAP